MEKSLTAQSFIVRVYRVDTEDRRKIAGQVEALDGSGKNEHFRNTDDLAAVLNHMTSTSRKEARKAKKKERLYMDLF